MMGFMWLFWILLIILVVWGLYRFFTTRSMPESTRESPLETLQRRYAAGELSTEEYEERKSTLQK